jgi:hypothetical protein
MLMSTITHSILRTRDNRLIVACAVIRFILRHVGVSTSFNELQMREDPSEAKMIASHEMHWSVTFILYRIFFYVQQIAKV